MGLPHFGGTLVCKVAAPKWRRRAKESPQQKWRESTKSKESQLITWFSWQSLVSVLVPSGAAIQVAKSKEQEKKCETQWLLLKMHTLTLEPSASFFFLRPFHKYLLLWLTHTGQHTRKRERERDMRAGNLIHIRSWGSTLDLKWCYLQITAAAARVNR